MNFFPIRSILCHTIIPDVFVEKSQLELRAEREAAQRANTKPKKAPQRDHQEFPTLGGAPKNQNTFWGVPGNSIQKSASSKKNKKKKGKNAPSHTIVTKNGNKLKICP